ncbi:MAG TPA: DNA repair protein RecO [Bacteroidia bacterium]|nr:DNA repair protein RecO [Bacteroidia bacterium]
MKKIELRGMLYQTQGIVFHTVPYSDNRVIAKIYTRSFGLQSFIVTVSRTKSGMIKSPLLQPLTQLELRIEKKEKSHLHTVREITLAVPYAHLHNDIVKTTIALFVAEVLYKSVKEEEANEGLYEFISHSLQVLDISHEGTANFHLVFMMNLTRYLGFFPQENIEGPNSLFDLVNGTFFVKTPQHFNSLDPVESRLFEMIFHADYEHMHELQLNAEKRKIVLNALVRYYEAHLQSMQKIQSHEVLAQILE